MRRRLTVTIVAVVAVCLLLAGAVTILLTAHAAREETRRDLVQQAQAMSRGVLSEETTAATSARARRLLQTLKPLLKVSDIEVFLIGPAGALRDPVTGKTIPPPAGISADLLRVPDLQSGSTVSGHQGGLVFAAAPAQVSAAGNVPVTQVVLLTRRPASGLKQVGGWFLIASVISLAAAVIAGEWLSRRFMRPLIQAEAVTRRIAAGDLSARVADPGQSVPELASLATSINTMAEALARSRGLERQFLLSVSHDLRTPLTSIRGFAEAIADGAATDTQRAAQVIASESRRLERLVRDLLELAKLDARRFSLDLRRVDLAEVARETAEGFGPAAAELGLRIAVPAADAVPVTADADRLAQIVANLTENALKFAARNIHVGVAMPPGADRAVLWVDDDGPGIDGEDLPRVFDRMFTSSRRPARQVGSGLGLAIVAELAAAMGGTVRAESPLGPEGGTRMVVTLRGWSEMGGAPPPQAAPAQPVSGATSWSSAETSPSS